jgi:hypothetical protein
MQPFLLPSLLIWPKRRRRNRQALMQSWHHMSLPYPSAMESKSESIRTSHISWKENLPLLCYWNSSRDEGSGNETSLIVWCLCILLSACLQTWACKPKAPTCWPHGKVCFRSAAYGDLQIPATNMVTLRPRSFAVAGPTTWNSLPTFLHDTTLTLKQFQIRLKIHLFSIAYVTR